METSPLTLKKHAYVALAAMVVLFFGGIFFYKDRLFFCDASYISFNALRYKDFCIQEHRYGSFITQLFLYAGVKLHLPIRVILKSYAFSFNFFYLVAAYIIHRCRQYGLVILMAFYYYLMVSDTYFWTNNEIHQAIAWMFLFFVLTLYMAERKTKMYVFLPVFLLLGFLALYTHFIVLIPTTFLWVYLYIKKDGLKVSGWVYILLTLCLAAIVVSKFLVVHENSYDDSHLHNVTHISLRDIRWAIVSAVVKQFLKRCIINYWVASVVFITGLIALIRNRERWLMVWTIASVTGYIVLMGITYGDWGADVLLFHIESEWQCIGILMAAPFVFSVLPYLKVQQGVVGLIFIFMIRICYIGNGYEKFAWRTGFKKQVMNKMREKGIAKLGLIQDNELKKQYMLDWALPDESILMSAMKKDDPQITFMFIDTADKSVMSQLSNPKMVYLSFEIVNPQTWNFEYFKPDTSHPYTIMSYKELMK